MSLLALLTALKADTEPVTPGPETNADPATLTTLRQVADNCAWWRISGTADKTDGLTIVTRHTMRASAKGLRIRQGVHGGAGADAGITGKALLVVRGAYHRLTWGGSETVTIPRLEFRTSDPLDESVVVAAGETFYTVWEASPGSAYPRGEVRSRTPLQSRYFGPFTGYLGPLDQSSISGAPSLILGKTNTASKSIVCLGDSILEVGWMRRAAASTGAAWTDLGQWAEGIPVGSLQARLTPEDKALFTLGLTEYGTNQRNSQVQDAANKMVESWTWLTAGPVSRLGQTTMVPYTKLYTGDGGAGSLATLDGQTETHAAWRNTMNTWLRDGAPIINGVAALTGGTGAVRAGQAGHPLIGICDIAAALEAKNSRGETVWRVDRGAATDDGTHPSVMGSDLMEPVAAQWFRDHI